MSKRKKNFKQESKDVVPFLHGGKTLEFMDSFFKEQSEKYRRRKR